MQVVTWREQPNSGLGQSITPNAAPLRITTFDSDLDDQPPPTARMSLNDRRPAMWRKCATRPQECRLRPDEAAVARTRVHAS